MRRQNACARIMPMGIAVATGLALCFAALTDAAAQRGGRSRLSPEKAEAAWTLQAHCVSQSLGLNKKKAGKVREAYVVARKSQQEARRELRNSSDGSGGRAWWQAFQELNQKERAKLGEALNPILSEEQRTQVMVSLGTFSRTWDRYVDLLADFEFAGDELSSALKLLLAHIIDTQKVRSEAMANQDFEGLRSRWVELKAKLDVDLAGVLSEAELARWKEQTQPRGRDGQRGGGGTG